MADETVAPPNVQSTLRDIDCETQSACDAIKAMAKAARVMLDMDANSLLQVAVLLDEIQARADILMNDINYQAEQHGANWIDESERALSSRLWDQHHKLHRTGEVQHG